MFLVIVAVRRRQRQRATRRDTTRRRARTMAAQLLSLYASVLCLCLAGVLAAPTPGRVPKVYNALITSNQNLEPSKAYPVYQPVLHDATFTFPLQPTIFYGPEFPITNGLLPPPALVPKDPNQAQPPPPAPSPDTLQENKPPSTEAAPPAPETNKIGDNKATPAPPLPINTQPPIPLNEFGLPPQVLPLGRINPAYDGFTQIGPFAYTYPGLRFYDPYDPFVLHSYGGLPTLYRPLANVLGQTAPVVTSNEVIPAASSVSSKEQPAQSPPPEPSDLNVLNYSSKDPAIPNVPPPPLPQGGLKTDKSD